MNEIQSPTQSGKQILSAENANKLVEYQSWGSSDIIKLSVGIVQKFLCEPTKSGRICSERDALRFVMFCQARRQNPFEGDCYLVGYDTQVNGTVIAKYSMITAESVFLKRAEVHPQFEGLESGLIVANGEQEKEIQGESYREPWECIGAWAKVYRKDRRVPFYDSLVLRKMMPEYPSPFWKKNPEHQIVKCARVAVLRRAFPSQLGGMYIGEESHRTADLSAAASVAPLPQFAEGTAQAAERMDSPAVLDASGTDLAPAAPPLNQALAPTQLQLRDYILSEGFTFDQFHAWASKEGQFGDLDPENVNRFEDVPEVIAKRLLRAKVGLKAGLQQLREREAK